MSNHRSLGAARVVYYEVREPEPDHYTTTLCSPDGWFRGELFHEWNPHDNSPVTKTARARRGPSGHGASAPLIQSEEESTPVFCLPGLSGV